MPLKSSKNATSLLEARIRFLPMPSKISKKSVSLLKNFISLDPLLEADWSEIKGPHPLDSQNPCISIALKSIDVKTSLEDLMITNSYVL
jgi:hypothetical protein